MDLLTRFGARVADRVESARWWRPAVLALLLVVLTAISRNEVATRRLGLPVALLLGAVIAGGAGLLVWRRLPSALRLPVFFLLLAASTAMVYLDGGGAGYVGGFVSASVAAAQTRRTHSVLMGVLAVGSLGVAAILGGDRSTASIVVGELGALAFYLVGRYSLSLRQRTEQAVALRLELEQSKLAQARGALLAERQRLAREMHDVLAHSLSGLMLHIESARLLAEHDPADPRLPAALDRANQLAHAGLDEARQAIGMLRDDELPGVRSLSIVVDEFRADTGITCELTVCGDEREIGSAVALAIYRVGQEALTNIRKHAAPERVSVELVYAPEEVRLTVADVGMPPDRPPNVDGGGYGLSGMRERAELLGGSLIARSTGTGFLVELRVPAS
ncbi:MAG TPA: sensor histidine kinase [Pseudonocardiaceae bacterium]|nr:sensor histidine kinase [Pseudonocardiaceae bacterium]